MIYNSIANILQIQGHRGMSNQGRNSTKQKLNGPVLWVSFLNGVSVLRSLLPLKRRIGKSIFAGIYS